MATQDNWRFCTKCYSLFWYGDPAKGVCPARGTHSPFQAESPTNAGTSWDFALQVASTSAPAPSPGGGGGASAAGTQGNWRFCTKCYSLFWYGNPTAGVCPAGAAHSPLESASPTHAGTSWDFQLQVVPNSPPAPAPGGGGGASAAGTQGNWRFCTKCYSLFWCGNPTAGVCPAGAAHSPLESASPTHAGTSWDFQLQVASTSGAPLPFTKMSWGKQGAVAQWNMTQNCPVIAENWDSIAAKNSARYYWYNNYDESPLQALGQWASSALNWFQQNEGTIGEFVSIFLEAFSGGDGSDTTQIVIPRAPLPAGVPTGAAASAGGGSSGLQASGTPAGNLAPPIGAKIPIDIPRAATTPGS